MRKELTILSPGSIEMLPRVCPVCESGERQFIFEDVNRREDLDLRSAYWRCRQCTMIYLHPMPNWAQFRTLYEEIFRQFEKDGIQLSGVKPIEPLRGTPPPGVRSSHILRRFFPHPRLKPVQLCSNGNLSVLDVGCGTGEGLWPFYWSGWSVTGVDLNSLAIEVCAKAMPQGRFIHQDFMDWDATDEAFDVIRTDNCLEHIPEPKAALAKITRLLKPGGRVYIFVPNGDSLLFRVLGRYHVSSWIPFHLSLFTPAAMRRLCENVGLKIEHFRTWQPHTWLKLSLQQLLMKPGFYNRTEGRFGLPDSAWKTLGAILGSFGRADEMIVWAVRGTPSGRLEGISQASP